MTRRFFWMFFFFFNFVFLLYPYKTFRLTFRRVRLKQNARTTYDRRVQFITTPFTLRARLVSYPLFRITSFAHT